MPLGLHWCAGTGRFVFIRRLGLHASNAAVVEVVMVGVVAAAAGIGFRAALCVAASRSEVFETLFHALN